MHMGLRLPNNGPNAVAERIIQVGQLAEKLGFDSLWTNDHIITPADVPSAQPYHRIYEAFITLAALSSVTSRVKLGVGVLIVPLREPVLLAKQAATIDAYSNGRMILGIGVGWERGEFRYLNVDFMQRGQRCDEWLCVIRAIWRGTAINVSTKMYQISGGMCQPIPTQPGGPPILIGGDSAAALRRAAQMGDGWMPASYLSLEMIADGVKKIKSLAGAEHQGLVYAFRRPAGSLGQAATVDQMMRELSALHKIGVQGCVLALPEAYTPEVVVEEMTLFSEKVMPQFR